MKRDDFFELGNLRRANNIWFKPSSRLSGMIPLSLGAALSLLLQVQVGAAGDPLPIRKLSVNETHEIVIEYASGTGKFPSKPSVQDFPGVNHRLVLDFPDAVIDRAAMPPAKTTLDELTKVFPDVRGIRYAALTGGTAPTARIVLDLPQSLEIKPHIVTLGESSVIIDLGLAPAAAQQTAQAPASADSAAQAAAQPEPTAGTRIQPNDNPADTTAPAATAAAAAPVVPAPAAAPAEPATPQSAQSEAPPAKTVASAPAPTAPMTEKSAISSAMGEGTTGGAQAPAPEAAPVSPQPAAPAPTTEAAAPEVAPPQTTKPELTQNSETLESRPSHDVDAPKPDSESQATMAASAGKGYDPNAAREAAAAQADKMSADGSAPDAGSTAASAAIPGATPATIQDNATSQKAAALRADAEQHFKAAVKYHMAGELPAAIAEYKATIVVNPNLAEPYCNLGLIYNQQHNYAAALDEFHKALAVNPKDAITYNGVGAALRAQKDLVGAMKNWQTAVSLDPKLATALYNLGTAYEMQKEFDKALEAYKQAASQDGRLGEAYYRMGLILQKRNNPTQAIEEFNKALKASTRAEYSDDARRRVALLSGKTPK